MSKKFLTIYTILSSILAIFLAGLTASQTVERILMKEEIKSMWLYDADDLEMNLEYMKFVLENGEYTQEELKGMNQTCEHLLNDQNEYSSFVLGQNGNMSICTDITEAYGVYD